MQRKTIPQHLKEVLLVSKYLTLYLVESQPPQRFIFLDPIGNYFKVTIDEKVSCSCLPGNRDHCMHTFYVLTKIYRLTEDDPLIFQPQYSQQQLQQIFSGERAKTKQENAIVQKKEAKEEIKMEKDFARKEQNEPKRETSSQRQDEKKLNTNKQPITKPIRKVAQKTPSKQSQSISQNYPPNMSSKQEQQYVQAKLDKGALCSICYQALQNQKPLLKCPSQCFNYFHIKCLKFWIDYQKKQQLVASCPMCRGKLPQNMFQLMKKTQVAFNRYYFSFEVDCKQCGEQIKGKLFRCLLCKQCNTCEGCYFSWKHLSHDRYLMKSSKRAEWMVPQSRSHSTMAKLDISLKYVKQFKDQQQMKAVFGENYSKFLEANLKKESLLEYLINSCTSVSKEIYKTYKKLDYEEKDIKCLMCKKGKLTEMRRLSCKHFIDEKCLTFLLINGERCCPLDKMPILQALPLLTLTLTKK